MGSELALPLMAADDGGEPVPELVVIGLVDAGEGGIADGAAEEAHPDAPFALALLVERQDVRGKLDEILCIATRLELAENVLRQMIERREQNRILVVEIMRERARRHARFAGHIDKPCIVDALFADHRNRGSGEVSTAGIVIDQFWHNGDYIKNPGKGKRVADVTAFM